MEMEVGDWGRLHGGVKTHGRKQWGDGGTRPPRFWTGGTKYTLSPQIFSLTIHFLLQIFNAMMSENSAFSTCTKCYSLLLKKCISYSTKSTKIVWRPGLRPGPHWGSSQRSPRPPSCFSDPHCIALLYFTQSPTTYLVPPRFLHAFTSKSRPLAASLAVS